MIMTDQSHFMIPIRQFPKEPAISEVVGSIKRRKNPEYFVTVCGKYCCDEEKHENCMFCHDRRGHVRVAAQFVDY